jgi:hypothetical protein
VWGSNLTIKGYEEVENPARKTLKKGDYFPKKDLSSS